MKRLLMLCLSLGLANLSVSTLPSPPPASPVQPQASDYQQVDAIVEVEQREPEGPQAADGVVGEEVVPPDNLVLNVPHDDDEEKDENDANPVINGCPLRRVLHMPQWSVNHKFVAGGIGLIAVAYCCYKYCNNGKQEEKKCMTCSEQWGCLA